MSFNIGRIRQSDEPYGAAWHPGRGGSGRPGGDDRENYVGEYDCPASAGCQNLWRMKDTFPEEVKEDADVEDLNELDDEYIYQSEESEEFEYESDSDLVKELEDGEIDCVSEDEWEKHDTDFVPEMKVSGVAYKVEQDQSKAKSRYQDDAYGNPKSKAKMQHCPVAKASTQSVTPMSNKGSETKEDWHKHDREGREPEHLEDPAAVGIRAATPVSA